MISLAAITVNEDRRYSPSSRSRWTTAWSFVPYGSSEHLIENTGKAVTGTPSYSEWIPRIANTTRSVFFLEKNSTWFTMCLNKIVQNLAILFVELKDGFKSNSDWVSDHLHDRNLVWTQLSFLTTLRGIKDMEAPPFRQKGIQEEHTQVRTISPAVSNRQPCRSSIHPPSGDVWTSRAFSVERWEHAQGFLMRKLTLQI